jgi:hypothetical protein
MFTSNVQTLVAQLRLHSCGMTLGSLVDVFLAVSITNCQELNQSNITVLHWFYLVTATFFDPYLDHHQAVFLNTSLIIELS